MYMRSFLVLFYLSFSFFLPFFLPFFPLSSSFVFSSILFYFSLFCFNVSFSRSSLAFFYNYALVYLKEVWCFGEERERACVGPGTGHCIIFSFLWQGHFMYS
jgi:hypothetical protein